MYLSLWIAPPPEVLDTAAPERPVATLRGPEGSRRSVKVQKRPSGDVFTVADLLWVADVDLDGTFRNSSARYNPAGHLNPQARFKEKTNSVSSQVPG